MAAARSSALSGSMRSPASPMSSGRAVRLEVTTAAPQAKPLEQGRVGKAGGSAVERGKVVIRNHPQEADARVIHRESSPAEHRLYPEIRLASNHERRLGGAGGSKPSVGKQELLEVLAAIQPAEREHEAGPEAIARQDAGDLVAVERTEARTGPERNCRDPLGTHAIARHHV